MALPLTNLTAWFDFSDNSTVFEAAADTAEDGDPIELTVSGNSLNRGLKWIGSNAERPTYKTATPELAISDAQFSFSSRLGLYLSTGLTSQVLSSVVTSTAKTLLISFYPTSITQNNSLPYNNNHLIGDGWGQFFGIYLRNPSSGVYKALVYNWDGNADWVELPLNSGLNSPYVIALTHNGTTLWASINGVSEGWTPSGATSNVTSNQVTIAHPNSTGGFQGSIGEIAIYNSALSGTNLDDAISYFLFKWAGAVVSPIDTRITQDAVEVVSNPGGGDVRVSQDAVEVVSKDLPPIYISQAAVEVVEKTFPPVYISQDAVEVVGKNLYPTGQVHIFIVS